MFNLPPEHYESNRLDLIAALAGALREGSLALLLGAGCSSGMNLLSWHEIANVCSEEASRRWSDKKALLATTFTGGTRAEDLFSRMEFIRKLYGDDSAYLQAIRGILYKNHPNGITGEPSDLLRAIGAMTISSRRGSVQEVISLNFDCLLEWYLGLHGMVTQVISRWPTLLGDADVNIYHPHGYLPVSSQYGDKSEMIIFDSAEVDKNISNQPAWRQVFKQLITSRIILAVGLGGRDYLLRSLLYDAMSEVKKEKARPLGCWLCTKSVNEETREQIRGRGFIVVSVDDKDEAPKLLFDVCCEARDRMLRW